MIPSSRDGSAGLNGNFDPNLPDINHPYYPMNSMALMRREHLDSGAMQYSSDKDDDQYDDDDQSEKPAKRKKRERRSKDDNFKRNYICGCGKSYLSYAALYTHAKTKHEGVFPEGTTTMHKKKQGRPKKDEWCALKINSQYHRSYDFNLEFGHFLEMIPGAKEEKEETQKNLIDCFPCELFSNQSVYEKILLNIEQMRKDLIESHGNNFQTQMDMIIINLSNIRKLNCNEIFALFLLYIFRFVTRDFYKELVFFVVAYRDMMNKVGWAKYKEMNDLPTEDTSKEFCEEQNGEFLPDFSNIFLTDYFTSYLTSNQILSNPASLSFLGLESIKLLRVILLIKHFCNWLFLNKLTKAKLDIQKD
jgi:hypothetical protein